MTQEFNLAIAKEIQAARLVDLGLPELIGIGEREYKDSISDPPEALEDGARDRYPLLALIEPRVTLGQAMDLFEDEPFSKEPHEVTFESYLSQIENGSELLNRRENIRFAQNPYWIWANTGTPHQGKSVLDVIKKPQRNERWLTATEAAFVTLHYRDHESINDNFFCPGTITKEYGEKVVILIEKIQTVGAWYKKFDRVRLQPIAPRIRFCILL